MIVSLVLEHFRPQVNIPPEKVADITGFLVDVINPSIMELRRLFLLESIFDTVKFILCLWGLTYIGSWFVFYN